MGRRRLSVENNAAVTFDSRCLRSDGRRWRCPMPALPNNVLCALHRTPSTRRRTNAVQSPSNVSDSKLPHLDPDPVAESDPKKADRSEDPLLMRRRKKRKKESGSAVEASALDPCSAEEPDLEKLNRILYPVEVEKERATKENGADNEGTTINESLYQPIETDSDLEKVNGVLDPVEIKQKPRKENWADSEGTGLDHSSDQPFEADSDIEKANQVLDQPAGIKKNNRKENGAHLEPSTFILNSDQPIEADKTCSDFEKANQTLDLNRKRRRREKGQTRKREKKIEMIKDKETDLIRMAMKKQVERREEREEKIRCETQIEEVRRELPNGVMAISSSPMKILSNADMIVDRKIGLGLHEGVLLKRRFRSKNVEPQPVGSVMKFPRVFGRSKNECGEKKTVNVLKKQCIPKHMEVVRRQKRIRLFWYKELMLWVVGYNYNHKPLFKTEMSDLDDKVPYSVYNGRCSCKTGKRMGAEDSVVEESANCQNKSSGIRYADYFISQLLPVLKILNWEQIFELEIEANCQGRGLAGIQLQVMECSLDTQFKCNFCRISIVNLHRSCSKCHYKLCSSCCREVRGERLPEGVDVVASEHPKEEKVCENGTKAPNAFRNEMSVESPIVHLKLDKKRDVIIPCPPSALGGCGDGVLDMKLHVPFGWTQQSCSTKQIDSNCNPATNSG